MPPGFDYPQPHLLIAGEARSSSHGDGAVINPAIGSAIGSVAHAGPAEVSAALDAAEQAAGFWARTAPTARARLLRTAAGLLRARAQHIGMLITLEMGKPYGEALAEV